MSIRVFYEHTTDAQYEEISDRLRLYTLDVTQSAESGSTPISQVVIDDPDGDYDIVGFRRMYFYDDAATGSNTVLYNGYVAHRTIRRGPYVTGAGRIWEVALADSNAVAHWRVMNGTDANRPAETAGARAAWLMATNEMSRITISTHVDTSSGVAMDAVDYRGQRVTDIWDDLSQATGWNYFVYTVESGGNDVGLGMWFKDSASTARASSIRLTNVLADVDNDLTFAISDDTILERDPSRVYSGAYIQYDGGSVYEESISTSNTFTRRDSIVPAENVKSAAKATARAQRYLAEMNTEADVITTSYYCPASRVNFLREGMTVQFKATHLPDYELYNTMRVLKRTIKHNSEDPLVDTYLVTVELGQNVPAQVIEPVVGPDVTLVGCNTVVDDTNRNINPAPTGGSLVDGEQWFFTITTTSHDANAVTEYLEIVTEGTVSSASLWSYNDISLPPGPFSASGSFTIPANQTGGSFKLLGKANYAGNALVNECWTLELFQL